MDALKAEIHILGTSHIAAQSVREIRATFEKFQPDIVAIELDRRRLTALDEPSDKRKSPPISLARQIGTTGWLFLVIGGWLQRKLGRIVNMEPGADMREAATLARTHQKKLALVDQDVLVTVRRLSQAFTWREKMRLVGDIFRAPFSKEKMSMSLDKVPEKQLLETIMGLLEKRYPSIYRVLVIERNVHMAVRLDAIARANPGKKILLVIGAGHEKDLRERLQRCDAVTIVR